MKRLLAALILVLLVAPAYAQDFDKGIEAYKRGDYTVALRNLRPLAEQGERKAQYWLGHLHAKGLGVPRDYKEAAKWYRKSANQGHAGAQGSLGDFYREGLGVQRDYIQAYKWLSLAARNWPTPVRNQAPSIKDRNRISKKMTPAQIARAEELVREWKLHRAAERGNAPAQANLGYMYEKGRGVSRDYAEAAKWYRKAAEQGHAGAQHNLGLLYSRGLGVQKDLAEAFRWLSKAAENGDLGAQVNLGLAYENGRGVAQDYPEAASWYRKSAERGHAMAQLSLGKMYVAGRGVARDDDEAERWYRKAAEQGLAAAQYELGLRSQHGRQDHVEAIKWYRRAAEQGNTSAQNDLGLIYHSGWVVPHDYGEALKWYRRAAERGQASAQHNLGTMYAEGLGVPQDYVQAYMWFSIYEAAGAGKAAGSPYIYVGKVSSYRDIADLMTPAEVSKAERLAREWRPKAPHQEPKRQKIATTSVPITEVQRLLNSLGYNSGPADGVIGNRTRSAIREFQRQDGLAVTGEVSKELITRLKKRVRVESAEDSQTRLATASVAPNRTARATECDTSAAHPSYTLPNTGTAGVRFEDIDAARTIVACTVALAESPDDPRLQFQLARGYHKSQQYREAAKYYRKAGAQGFAPAQMTLGYFYANGLGVPTDPAKAAKWLREASDQGDAPAQFSLGALYAAGQGVPQDYVEAYKWASLAAAQGNKNAIEVRNRAASQMNPAQIAEAERLARKWLEKHPQ